MLWAEGSDRIALSSLRWLMDGTRQLPSRSTFPLVTRHSSLTRFPPSNLEPRTSNLALASPITLHPSLITLHRSLGSHCSLPTAHCSLITDLRFPTPHCFPLVPTHHLPLTTHCSFLTPCHPLRTTHHSSLITGVPLLTHHLPSPQLSKNEPSRKIHAGS
jgi:hypothetical protein